MSSGQLTVPPEEVKGDGQQTAEDMREAEAELQGHVWTCVRVAMLGRRHNLGRDLER